MTRIDTHVCVQVSVNAGSIRHATTQLLLLYIVINTDDNRPKFAGVDAGGLQFRTFIVSNTVSITDVGNMRLRLHYYGSRTTC